MANNKYSRQPRPKYNISGGSKKGRRGAVKGSNRKGKGSDSSNNS